MKTLFRILGTAAAVAVTGAAIVALDKILNQKDPLHVEEVEFPEDAELDPKEAEKAAEAYAEGEAKAADEANAEAAASETPEAAAEPAAQPAEEAAAPAAPAAGGEKPVCASLQPKTVSCRCWRHLFCAAARCGCWRCRSLRMWTQALSFCGVQAARPAGRAVTSRCKACRRSAVWSQRPQHGCGHPSCSAHRCWHGLAGWRPFCPAGAALAQGPSTCIFPALRRWERTAARREHG